MQRGIDAEIIEIRKTTHLLCRIVEERELGAHEELAGKDAKTVFAEFAKRLSAHGLFRVRNMLRGIPQRIPAQLLTTILHLVEEAHTNAVKHGGARHFILVADPAPGGFTVRLLNDGEPFDAASAPGPESGHYGLVGMRERAKRAGVRIFWETRKRWNVFRIEVKT